MHLGVLAAPLACLAAASAAPLWGAADDRAYVVSFSRAYTANTGSPPSQQLVMATLACMRSHYNAAAATGWDQQVALESATATCLRQLRGQNGSSGTESETAAATGATAAEDAGGDPRLVGQWVSQTVMVSGDASFASEQVIIATADGRFLTGPARAVAGGGGWSWNGGGGGGSQGRWKAWDGVLFVAEAGGGWRRLGSYGITDDGQTMRIRYDAGGSKIWVRR